MKFFISLLGLIAFSTVQPGELRLTPGKVFRIVDGDTIVFTQNKNAEVKNLKVRMIGVDTPETHLVTDHGVVSQGYWGEAATAYLKRLIPAKTDVLLQKYGNDKYDRMLGRVFYKNDGKDFDVNLVMIQAGWGIPYIICEGRMCDNGFFQREKVANYFRACEESRAQGRGIHNPSRRLEEMPFEFRLREQKRKPDKWVGDVHTKKLYNPRDYKEVDLCSRIFFFKKDEAEAVGFNE